MRDDLSPTNDLRNIEARMDKIRDAYTNKLLRGEITRAQTTTYNACMGQLAERRDYLRKSLVEG